MVGPFCAGYVHRTITLNAIGWCISCTLLSAQEVISPPDTSHESTSSPVTSPPDTSHQSSNPQLGIYKLDNKSRAKALAALAALVILGFGMVALTWLGARVTKRYMNPTPFDHERLKSSAPPADDWAKKPLVDNSESDQS